MPRKITIKTLEQALKLTGPNSQINMQSLLNGNLYHKDRGWISVNIDPELRRKIADEISEQLGGFARTRHDVYMRLRRTPAPQHWGLGRFVLSKYNKGPVSIEYITGQDQTWEFREIRKALRG